jgi:hypothetical protein
MTYAVVDRATDRTIGRGSFPDAVAAMAVARSAGVDADVRVDLSPVVLPRTQEVM